MIPGKGNPLQYSCLENSMNRGAWRAIVHGVTKNRTRLNTVIEQNQLLNLNKDFYCLSSVSPHCRTWFYGAGISCRKLQFCISLVNSGALFLLGPFIFKHISTGKTSHLTTLSVKHLIKITHMVYSSAYNTVYSILPKKQSN